MDRLRMLGGVVRQFLIRVLAFVTKEVIVILHQPSLLLALVLGPFLILLLFALGYRNEARPLRTLFVVSQGDELRKFIDEYATSMGPQLEYMGTIDSEKEAKGRLSEGLIDLVVLVPTRVYETISQDEQAVFTLYHNEIDPFQVQYVRGFGQVYVSALNHRVVSQMLRQGQDLSRPVEKELASARDSAEELRRALERGDKVTAASSSREVEQSVSAATLAVGLQLSLLRSLQDAAGSPDRKRLDPLVTTLEDLQQVLSLVQGLRGANNVSTRQQVQELERNLDIAVLGLDEFQTLDPDVMLRPFRSDTRSIMRVDLKVMGAYAPGVVVVLLQHLCVTFAALSLVDEDRTGALELFRVAPLSVLEMLLGKNLSFMIVASGLAAILTPILVYLLGVPMLGSWLAYATAVWALAFASLGVGFLLSVLSRTTSQAIQYSMLQLLMSVFFSGFFISLEQLWRPGQIVSWLLPATYGVQLVQDVMLRGKWLDTTLIAGLVSMGIFLFGVTWFLLRRRLAHL
jgi:ABC-2 type transport system permease protein